MIAKAFDLVVAYLSGRAWWPRVQPVFLLLVAFVASQALLLSWVRAEYGFDPSLRLFLGSYLFTRSLVVLGAACLLLAVWSSWRRHREGGPEHTGWRSVAAVAAAAGVVVALAATGFRLLSPRPVQDVTIKLLDPPRDFRVEPLAYLVYELNGRQSRWFFDVDYDVFNPRELTSKQRAACEASERRHLCYAEAWAAARDSDVPVPGRRGPLVLGITSEPLEGAYFGEHLGRVSVISTADHDALSPVGVYRYLAFSILLQSMLLHLDATGGLPARSFEKRSVSRGGLFEYAPRRELFKPAMLAARLSPQEQELVLNRFGPEYLATCRRLLGMEWMREPRVAETLERYFGIEEGAAASP